MALACLDALECPTPQHVLGFPPSLLARTVQVFGVSCTQEHCGLTW
jgi:hypothetical protein